MNYSTQGGARMQAPDGSSPPKIPYHESRNEELDGNKFLPPYPSAAAFDHNETDILLEDDSRKLHLSSILTDDQPAVISEPVSAKAFPTRYGKKCAECRRQHQHCDVALQEKLLSASGQSGSARCSRCVQRNINCIQGTSPQYRFCPRPTRTGRRIELGRQLHGSTMYADDADNLFEEEQQIYRQRFELSWPRIYLRLIHCYFNYAYTVVAVPEYERFAHAFNRSFGDPTLMARYLNGLEGDEATCSYFKPKREYSQCKEPNALVEAYPETVELLLTVMCAWGAHYIMLPFDQVNPECFTHMGHKSLRQAAEMDYQLGFSRKSPTDPPHNVMPVEGTKRRHKRRQGVACDTCRLRRVRCDLMEQPLGTKACSRCRVKRIVCTDRYIQWKRERDMLKNPNGTAASVPEVQLLPKREEFDMTGESIEDLFRISQPNLFDFGKSRESTCNYFINRALMLVHKYDLVNRRCIQSAAALLILSSLLDYRRPDISFDAHRVAVQHLKNLFTGAFFDLNLLMWSHTVPELIRPLSANRVLFSAYLRDAIFHASHHREPLLCAEWFKVGFLDPDGSLRPLTTCELVPFAQKLSPESSVAFCILLGQRIASVGHSIYRDVILQSKNIKLPPTMETVQPLCEACQRLWDDLYAVETTLHILYAKCGSLFTAIRPVNVLMWAWNIFSMQFLLYQSVSRRINDWAIASYSLISLNDDAEGHEELTDRIYTLMRKGQKYTLNFSRVMALFVHQLIPTGLVHRGTALIRNTFRIARVLSRTPPMLENVHHGLEHDSAYTGSRPILFRDLLNPQPEPPNKEPIQTADPPSLVYPDDVSVFLQLPFSRSMGAFTREVRDKEIDYCIQALRRVGFSFPNVDMEMSRIFDTVNAMQ